MPKSLRSGAREIVLKVRAFCESEKANKGPLFSLYKVRARVAAMTGVSEKTVSRILKEAANQAKAEATPGENGEAAPSTSKKTNAPTVKKRNRKKKVELDDFIINAVRNKIHNMYTIRNEVPTLNKLLVELKNEIDFKGSRTTLWKIIQHIGIKFNKRCGPKKRKLSAENSGPPTILDEKCCLDWIAAGLVHHDNYPSPQRPIKENLAVGSYKAVGPQPVKDNLNVGPCKPVAPPPIRDNLGLGSYITIGPQPVKDNYNLGPYNAMGLQPQPQLQMMKESSMIPYNTVPQLPMRENPLAPYINEIKS